MALFFHESHPPDRLPRHRRCGCRACGRLREPAQERLRERRRGRRQLRDLEGSIRSSDGPGEEELRGEQAGVAGHGHASVIQNKIYEKVTAGVQVNDKDVTDYYAKNTSQYIQPASRDVRHILVKKKALADQIYQQLTHGANFAALAKKYSTDPSSKDSGGKLTISKGRQVPEFDKVAFALKTHEIGKPVKTSYGWHVIQALTPVKPRSVTKLSEVKTAIRQQLLGQKKQEEMRKWVDQTTKDFE